ncbi:MAG TPA: hypothetical protein VEL11_11125 [Candidatus Bathyarchaeia archaeon]|nr:hypothetical protein [Candidatus Bathyarchaeia archaeon]
MNTFSLAFSIIGIVAMVFLFGNHAFAYGGYGDYGGYPYGGYGDYGGYPYGGYYDPGSPPPYAYCSYADFKKNVPLYGDCSYYPFGY